MSSSHEVVMEDPSLARWWNDLRERGSEATIIGSGPRKRIVKNSDLMSMIYFLRRWFNRGRRNRARRRYSNSENRLYRLRVLNALGKKGSFASLKYWLHRMRLNCKKNKLCLIWMHAEDHGKIRHVRGRLMHYFSEFRQYYTRNIARGGFKKRSNLLRGYLEKNKTFKLIMTFRLWAWISKSARMIKRRVFNAFHNSFRLQKLAIIWKKMISKDAFFRLLRRGRWPKVQAKYVASLKVPEKLSFWHILTLLRNKMKKINKIGRDYFIDRKLCIAFKALRDREGACRMRRIEGYMVTSKIRTLQLARYLDKFISFFDPIQRKLKTKCTEKCRNHYFGVAWARVVVRWRAFRSINAHYGELERMGMTAYHRQAQKGVLDEWQAYLITKKRHHRLLMKSSESMNRLPLKIRRGWNCLQRRRLYAFVYDTDTKVANAFFYKEYFRKFKLTIEGIFLDRQQGERARSILLGRKRAPALLLWRKYSKAAAKMKSAIRKFNLTHRVKRHWFVRHFTHIRLQHRVRIAATLWNHRKLCKFVIKALIQRLRARKYENQRIRTFRVLNPLPQCSFAPQVFSAWKNEFLPPARRQRLLSEAVALRNCNSILSNAFEGWNTMFFHLRSKRMAMRSALRQFIELVLRRRTAWYRLVASCTAGKLSALEKSKLSEVLGKHRIALRCGHTDDIKDIFMRSINEIGHKTRGNFERFALRTLLRVQHLRLSKLHFVSLMRLHRAFIAWAHDYTVQSRQCRLKHAQNYAAIARRAANYREAALTAEEMGKFAVVMRVFYHWRDPLRRRSQALGKLLRKTNARKYLRRWYLLQRKFFVDRTLPTPVLSHQRSRNASLQGSYCTNANIARSRSASPGTYPHVRCKETQQRLSASTTCELSRGRNRLVPTASTHGPEHRSHSVPKQFSPSTSYSSAIFSSSISTPLSERATKLASELQQRLRGEKRVHIEDPSLVDSSQCGDSDGKSQPPETRSKSRSGAKELTAAQRGMLYDKKRRQSLFLQKEEKTKEKGMVEEKGME